MQLSHRRVQEVQLGLLRKDLSTELTDFDEAPTCNEPPPLNHNKRPVSRLLHLTMNTSNYNVNEAGSPWVLKTPLNMHSPPTNEVNAMRLIDDESPTIADSSFETFTAPRIRFPTNKLLFGISNEAEQRRTSAPTGLRMSFSHDEVKNGRKRKHVANINPFTPTSMLASLKKKFKSEPEL